jgi:hypothetical protein
MAGRSVSTHWAVHAHPAGRAGIGGHMLQPVGAANPGPELGRAEGRRLFGLDPHGYEADVFGGHVERRFVTALYTGRRP